MDIKETNKLYLGNCIDVMATFPNECIDLTVTSPPYDNMRTYNNTCEWNFAVFKKVAKELFRITKWGGVIVWVVSDSTNDGTEMPTEIHAYSCAISRGSKAVKDQGQNG